ncbi:TIR domain-containing protein [Phthorimaea operculella]|nr:TIR domain-containing protein [Phthorimaea operculella]
MSTQGTLLLWILCLSAQQSIVNSVVKKVYPVVFEFGTVKTTTEYGWLIEELRKQLRVRCIVPDTPLILPRNQKPNELYIENCRIPNTQITKLLESYQMDYTKLEKLQFVNTYMQTPFRKDYTADLPIKTLEISNVTNFYVSEEFFASLIKLRELVFGYIEVPVLPKTMQLESLTLKYSPLKSWDNCQHQKQLIIEGLNEEQIPVWPENCTQLQVIRLKSMGLDTVHQLTESMNANSVANLEILSITNCSIVELPLNLMQSQNFREICFSTNNLDDKTISHFPTLPNLEVLDLSNNYYIVNNMPLVLSRTPSLRELNINGTGLFSWRDSFPLREALTKLTSLTRLYLNIKLAFEEVFMHSRFTNLTYINMKNYYPRHKWELLRLHSFPSTQAEQLEVDVRGVPVKYVSIGPDYFERFEHIPRSRFWLTNKGYKLVVRVDSVDCDCNNLILQRALRLYPHFLSMPNLKCHHGGSFLEEPAENLSCRKATVNGCVRRMSRGLNYTTVVDCSRNDKQFHWPQPRGFRGFNASGNLITSLDKAYLPDSLEVLYPPFLSVPNLKCHHGGSCLEEPAENLSCRKATVNGCVRRMSRGLNYTTVVDCSRNDKQFHWPQPRGFRGFNASGNLITSLDKAYLPDSLEVLYPPFLSVPNLKCHHGGSCLEEPAENLSCRKATVNGCVRRMSRGLNYTTVVDCSRNDKRFHWPQPREFRGFNASGNLIISFDKAYLPDSLEVSKVLKPHFLHHGGSFLEEPAENLSCRKATVNGCVRRMSRGLNYTTVVDCSRNDKQFHWPQPRGFRGFNASGNLITLLDKAYLPDSLEWLDLRNNSISRLDGEQSMRLFGNKGRRVWLTGNPIVCDCDNQPFLDALHVNQSLVMDFDNLTCAGSGELLRQVSATDLCRPRLVTVSAATSLIAVLLLVAALLIRHYWISLRMVLYAHGCCLSCLREKDLDEDRPYDAFLSFAHGDDQYVMEKLLPMLEGEPNNYRICVHYRDWSVGEWIPAQIMQSVRRSKRTIIVLSKNFINSCWGVLEFRHANAGAAADGRKRLLVLVLDDVLSEKLSPELQGYLELNTYLECSDPWFWEKLRYAMPHKDSKHPDKREYRNLGSMGSRLHISHNVTFTKETLSMPEIHSVDTLRHEEVPE